MEFTKFRELVNEAITKKTTKQPYHVARYHEPNSSKVIDSTVVHAANKAELHGHVRKWMEKIGLDPDDEDDHSYIKVHSQVNK
jgi:hypothetical protein